MEEIRRAYTRYPFHHSGLIVTDHGLFKMQLLNISQAGFGFFCPDAGMMRRGSVIRVCLLDDQTKDTVVIPCQIRHASPNVIGVQMLINNDPHIANLIEQLKGTSNVLSAALAG